MSNESYQPPEEQSLLADDPDLILRYEEASIGKRFGNFIIDVLVCQYGIGFLSGYLFGTILRAVNPGLLYDIVYGESRTSFYVYAYIVSILTWVFYYTICEKAFKGMTLGKLITGTRAIREDGSELTFKDALLRSLVRIVPFEPLSAFAGRPWHDSWTNTRVVRK